MVDKLNRRVRRFLSRSGLAAEAEEASAKFSEAVAVAEAALTQKWRELEEFAKKQVSSPDYLYFLNIVV